MNKIKNIINKKTQPANYKKIVISIVDADKLKHISEPHAVIFEDSLWNGNDGAKKHYLDIITYLSSAGFVISDKSKWNTAAEMLKATIRMDKRIDDIKSAAIKIANKIAKENIINNNFIVKNKIKDTKKISKKKPTKNKTKKT